MTGVHSARLWPRAQHAEPDKLASHTKLVYTEIMKNITFSADEDLIEQARIVARSQRKTLNQVFREWLSQFTSQAATGQDYRSLMRRLKHVRAGRRFTRDEMNQR
jgi:hypothetical protein